MQYVKMRVEKTPQGQPTVVTSHELEDEGRRFVERALGRSVNPSTISRKWRIIKKTSKQVVPPSVHFLDEIFVVVRDLPRKVKKEGRWEVLAIQRTSVNDIKSASEAQLTMF